MSETPAVSLSRIAQVAINVRDLARGVAFYRDVCGMRFLFQAPNVAFFDCAGVRFMLGQDEPPPRDVHGTIVYFAVPDIRVAFDAIKAKGAEVEREPHVIARLPDREVWLAYFRDPDGNLVPLMSEVPTH